MRRRRAGLEHAHDELRGAGQVAGDAAHRQRVVADVDVPAEPEADLIAHDHGGHAGGHPLEW